MSERDDDYQLDPDFDPQSRFDNLADIEPEFWKHKKLGEMSPLEWELLCDGCGKCCLNKIEIRGKIRYTNTHCRFLNCRSCACRIYPFRHRKVPDCRDIDLAAVREKPRWLPKTCAYWLLDNNLPLPDWHPLLTGRLASVHEAKMSLVGRELVNETGVEDYENHLVDWPDL